MSDPQRPHGLQPSRLLHPWDFPGKSTGVGCHCFLRPVYYKSLQLRTANEGPLLGLRVAAFLMRLCMRGREIFTIRNYPLTSSIHSIKGKCWFSYVCVICVYLCACVYVFFSDYACNSGILENFEKMKPRFLTDIFPFKKNFFFFFKFGCTRS